MIYKHVVFDLESLVEKIKKCDIIFVFLDALAIEIKKVSKKKETIDDIIFIDYKDQSKHIVNIQKANQILKNCFDKYYLDLVLQDISIEIETNNSFLLKKSLLFLLKNLKNFKKKVNNNTFINYLLEISEDFNNFSKEEYILYCNFIKKSNFDIKKLNQKFETVIDCSTETFTFSSSFDYTWHSCRTQIYFDVKYHIIDVSTKFTNNRIIDLLIQHFILISFINAKFYMNYDADYSDNSYTWFFAVPATILLPKFLKK